MAFSLPSAAAAAAPCCALPPGEAAAAAAAGAAAGRTSSRMRRAGELMCGKTRSFSAWYSAWGGGEAGRGKQQCTRQLPCIAPLLLQSRHAPVLAGWMALMHRSPLGAPAPPAPSGWLAPPSPPRPTPAAADHRCHASWSTCVDAECAVHFCMGSTQMWMLTCWTHDAASPQQR